MGLGLLVQRAAGVGGPEPASWESLIARIVASFGEASATKRKTMKGDTHP